MKKFVVLLLVCIIAVSKGEIETELSKLMVEEQSTQPKDFGGSASDRFPVFVISRDLGYGYKDDNNRDSYYGYNHVGYIPNLIYRGYQSGSRETSREGNYGWRIYGRNYAINYGGSRYGLGTGNVEYGYGVGSSGYGGNQGSNLDGGYEAYGGNVGSKYNNYLYDNRGYGEYNPSGYRGYS